MGKFHSFIYQENGFINAEQLYADIEKSVEEEKRLKNVEKLDRTHPLQHILNSTSGNYVSPTAMKSFDSCPAGYLYAKLVKEKVGSATSVGSSFHRIMELFYESDPDLRMEKQLFEITDRVIEEDKQFDKANDLKLYVKGYMESLDYLTNKPMDHSKLDCANEVFIKPIVNPLGVNLNIPIYLKIDRIDVRNEGICIIDYKTGFGDPNEYLLGENGYLPQMIYYKWGVEAEYGQEIHKAYLCLPGSDSIKNRYVEMNVNSLVEQSKVIEKTIMHLDYAKEVRESKKFPEKIMRYCNSCQMKNMCYTYIKNRKLDENNIKNEIEINMEWDENSDVNMDSIMEESDD